MRFVLRVHCALRLSFIQYLHAYFHHNVASASPV